VRTEPVATKRKPTEDEKAAAPVPKFLLSIVLTIVVLGTVVAMGEKVSPAVMVPAGTCVASMINHPELKLRRKRVDMALMVASILLAGVFAPLCKVRGYSKPWKPLASTRGEIHKQLSTPAVFLTQAALHGQATIVFPLSPLTPTRFLIVGLTGPGTPGVRGDDDRLRPVRRLAALNG